MKPDEKDDTATRNEDEKNSGTLREFINQKKLQNRILGELIEKISPGEAGQKSQQSPKIKEGHE